MTDTRKESLSALIDGEASEIEVHRLVREFRDDASLTQSWAVYQHIRATVRSRADDAGQLKPHQHESLLGRISDAIHEEETHTAAAPASQRSGTAVIGGSLALAASLVIAVFLGVQNGVQDGVQNGVQNPEAESGSPAVAMSPQAIQVTPVSTNPISGSQAGSPAPVATLADNVSDTTELMELDEEKQRRLRAYLNQHERMARTVPDTQLVNFKKDD